MMKIHELKTWNPFFQDMISGKKNFELRKNNRGFKVGDRLDLMEYDPAKDEYTGNHCHKFVKYILIGGDFGLKEGYCIMGLTDEIK